MLRKYQVEELQLLYRHGHQDCVRLLLSRGAQLLRTNEQETPLDIAVKVHINSCFISMFSDINLFFLKCIYMSSDCLFFRMVTKVCVP